MVLCLRVWYSTIGYVTLDFFYLQKISSNEVIPNICYDCKEKIDDFYSFKQKSQKNYEIFQTWCLNLKEMSDESLIIQHEEQLHSFPSGFSKFSTLLDVSSSRIKEFELFEEISKDISEELSENVLEKNEKLKTNQKSFVCSQCGISVATNYTLKRHINNKHSGQLKIKTHKCQTCSFETKNKTLLNHHNKKNHNISKLKSNNSQKNLFCSCCGKLFLSKSSVMRHEESMKTDLSFICGFCGERLKTEEILKRHITDTHLNEPKFKCDLCDMKFKRKAGLISHTYLHSNYRPFKCKKINCSAAFNSSFTLKKHELVHSEKRNFSCQICFKTFKSTGHKISHMKHHEKIKPHRCKCEATFFTKRALKTHLRDKMDSENHQEIIWIPTEDKGDEEDEEQMDEEIGKDTI